MSYLVLVTLFIYGAVASSTHCRTAPTARVKNGTLEGLYSAQYNQDFFLGIPYAQPPLHDLRFNLPHSLNSSWHGSKEAKEYSPECVGYGVSILILQIRVHIV